MWATLGKYLRKSMLLTLAKMVSHTTLPEVFYKGTTFDEDPSSLKLGSEMEKLYTMDLAQRVKELEKHTNKVQEEEDEEEGNGEDD